MAVKEKSRPNILLIYTDQQRRDSLGCYGNPLAGTPRLDALAGEGFRLNNYFVQNPVCSPSRMSFLTGRYCSSLRVGTNGIPFPDSGATPAHRILGPYGYHTAQIGKLHFLPHSLRRHRDPHPDYGFDTFILSDEPGCYDDAYVKWVQARDPDMVEKIRTALPPAALGVQTSYSDQPRDTHEPYIFGGDERFTHSAFVASEVCDYIDMHAGEPFFAIAGLYAPHAPVNPPERFVRMFDEAGMPLPRLGPEEEFAPGLKNVTDSEWRRIVAHYLALVSHVDDCAGRIIDKLKEHDIFDDTIVIFTSDHGEYLGDHGAVGKGAPGHDCIIRVPFIMSYPRRIAAGTVTEELVEAVDVLPTILDFCGVQTPTAVQGVSFRGLAEGAQTTHRDDVLMEFFVPGGAVHTAVRTATHKYCCNSDGREILYDLQNDPDELHNVAGGDRCRGILGEMRRRMIVRMQEAAYLSEERIAEY